MMTLVELEDWLEANDLNISVQHQTQGDDDDPELPPLSLLWVVRFTRAHELTGEVYSGEGPTLTEAWNEAVEALDEEEESDELEAGGIMLDTEYNGSGPEPLSDEHRAEGLAAGLRSDDGEDDDGKHNAH